VPIPPTIKESASAAVRWLDKAYNGPIRASSRRCGSKPDHQTNKGERSAFRRRNSEGAGHLGEGGNGVALLCGTSSDKVVAKIYVPPDKRDLDERALARFESEIKLTSTIRHPNVVRAIASGKMALGAYSLPFYIMPRAASTLRNFTNHHGNDPREIETRMRLFLRAALGVACLHSYGIVHRDLKPENILIGKNGQPWVADLGIAHVNPDFVSVGVRLLRATACSTGTTMLPSNALAMRPT
jgi:serine/threonine protein kinase